MISNKQKRVLTSNSQYIINAGGGNLTSSGRQGNRQQMVNFHNDKDYIHEERHNTDDSNDDFVTMPPPGQ